jgi:hypothetical protein
MPTTLKIIREFPEWRERARWEVRFDGLPDRLITRYISSTGCEIEFGLVTRIQYLPPAREGGPLHAADGAPGGSLVELIDRLDDQQIFRQRVSKGLLGRGRTFAVHYADGVLVVDAEHIDIR